MALSYFGSCRILYHTILWLRRIDLVILVKESLLFNAGRYFGSAKVSLSYHFMASSVFFSSYAFFPRLSKGLAFLCVIANTILPGFVGGNISLSSLPFCGLFTSSVHLVFFSSALSVL